MVRKSGVENRVRGRFSAPAWTIYPLALFSQAAFLRFLASHVSMFAGFEYVLLWLNNSLIGLFLTSWAVALPLVVALDRWWRGGGDLAPVEGV